MGYTSSPLEATVSAYGMIDTSLTVTYCLTEILQSTFGRSLNSFNKLY